MATHISRSAEETVAYGRKIAADLKPNSVLCFFGDLGAGKTTLIKGIVAYSTGISEQEIVSPTYIYLHSYPGKTTVHHFDLYRLQDPEEFLAMGFDEMLEAGGITCIEWSERIQNLLPPHCIKIFMEHEGDGIRQITIERP
ncbi:MAG: tRNA (adenosine(37)-N6)-threonylcarbamoyltransferase complex ATPase subunit type 1 TsaE [Parachlamydiales bacterium]|nr:tRNA (adenosine(37)-N6)-threonylcarbamoyltransferase complex ATPase subunit type 1 TsaE [Parachlamydiales bacterium]